MFVCCDLERKRWICSTSFLCMLTISLLGFVIYLTVFDPVSKDELIRRRFDSIFYTPEEIHHLMEAQSNGTGWSCGGSCGNDTAFPYANRDDDNTTGRLGRVQASPSSTHQDTSVVYQSCCSSRRQAVAPTEQLRTFNGSRRVRAVQFPDRRQRQYYFREECEPRTCATCTCQVVSSQVMMFVLDDLGDDMVTSTYDGAVMELVTVPSCCKCINNANYDADEQG